jgi:hypothetical protein
MKNLLNTKILTLFALFIVAVLFSTSMVSAKVDKNIPVENATGDGSFCGNEGFNCECQNFYNDSDYYAIEKFAINDGEDDYSSDEANSLYSYFNIDVTGYLKAANWTSNPAVYSVLVKAGNDREEFNGGTSGSVDSKKDISHITFCGYRTNNGGGDDGGDNGVPVFPGVTIGAAVLVVTLGLVFIRKN